MEYKSTELFLYEIFADIWENEQKICKSLDQIQLYD